MKILQVENIVSPHQIPLAKSIVGSIGTDSFRYAATERPVGYRIAMGWNCDDSEPWILRMAMDESHRAEYLRWWHEADIVFCGIREIDLMERRLKAGKICIYFSERWWKPPIGILRMLSPKFLRMAMRFRRLSQSPDYYYLPIGHYASRDMKRLADVQGKSWLWGYFTELPPVRPPIRARVDSFEVMYAGRMLGWKRIDVLIRAFRIVVDRAPRARLTIIGDGIAKNSIIALVRALGLGDAVGFLPSIPMTQVWGRMNASHVFVLPSDEFEGWGAVANEAFTQGCVLVSSAATGAGVTIIRNRENGLLFRPGDHCHLAYQICRLAGDEEFRLNLARTAQRDIYDLWSPATAADRLIGFCRSVAAKGIFHPPQTGPMSKPIW